MKHFIRISFLLVLILNQQAFSQQKDSIAPITKNRLLTQRFVLNLGLFVSSKTVKVGIDGSDEDLSADYENDFDYNEYESTLSVDFYYRFSKNKKWSVAFEYFGVKTSNQQVLESEIEWDDTIYPVGAEVEAGFDFNLYRVFFGRTISRGDKHELIGGLGIHAINIRAYLQGIAYLGDDDIELDLVFKPVSIIAPVPNVGVKYIYAPNSKWTLGARVDWFSLNTGTYNGYLWNIAPSVTYTPFKHAGLGVSYRYFNTSLEIDENAWHGNIDFLYHGPLFYLTINF